MSATIKYKQVKQEGSNLAVSAPSLFMKAMKNAGYELPCNLSRTEIVLLKGMSAALDEDNNEYDRLIEAIESMDEIQVWADY